MKWFVAAVLSIGWAMAYPAAEPALDSLATSAWQEGRSTFYGNGDGYSIDGGHCMYGGIPNPRIIAALSIWDGFGGNWRYTNCGRCFELKCRNGPRYNCRGDRLNSSLIVMVTDKCPCNRWCCGDEPHFDLSYWGFGEIGNHGGGVISLWWRPIECPEAMGRGGELVLNPQEYAPFCKDGQADDLIETAVNRGLTSFAQALWATGLHDEVADRKRKMTVLAPTNAAFDEWTQKYNMTLDEVLQKPFMKEVIQSHIIADASEQSSKTQNESITLANNDNIILEEVEACNGELDIVNKVLTPWEGEYCQDKQSIYQAAKGLSKYVQLIEENGMETLLDEDGKFTVFAYTDEAYDLVQGMQGKASDMLNVAVGSIHLDFKEDCSDRGVPRSAVDSLYKEADSAFRSNAETNMNCKKAKALGLCEYPWVSKGYCPITCGDCRPLQELESGFTVQTVKGHQLAIYPSSAASQKNKPPPYDFVVDGMLKIVDVKNDLCNGILYVLDVL